VACVFCDLQSRPGTDADKYILFRGARNFIVLNLYPYTSGHVMVVPFEHTADLHTTPKEITDEMMDLTKRCQDAIGAVYKPDGFNLGMNQGSAAGAGVAGHIHMHVLPRWVGDANFVSTIGETRVLPEALDITYRKLKACFE
jgi:ATP adenylyltransferase